MLSYLFLNLSSLNLFESDALLNGPVMLKRRFFVAHKGAWMRVTVLLNLTRRQVVVITLVVAGRRVKILGSLLIETDC